MESFNCLMQVFVQKMIHGRGIYMCDSPGPCYEYGKILILSKVLCSSTAGDTLKVSRGTGPGSSIIYVIKKVENILPYCVINRHQTLGNGTSSLNQPPIIPAHVPRSIPFPSTTITGPSMPGFSFTATASHGFNLQYRFRTSGGICKYI